jgi:hypothetical protein
MVGTLYISNNNTNKIEKLLLRFGSTFLKGRKKVKSKYV